MVQCSKNSEEIVIFFDISEKVVFPNKLDDSKNHFKNGFPFA
jgi:hypothetical protein